MALKVKAVFLEDANDEPVVPVTTDKQVLTKEGQSTLAIDMGIIQEELSKKVEGTEIDNLNARIDNIITSPAEGITEQEIIDARQGKTSLGENITSLKDDISQISNDASFYITNSVKNGDFKDGLNNWETHPTYATLSVIDGYGVLNLINPTTTYNSMIRQALDTVPNHKYYVQMDVLSVRNSPIEVSNNYGMSTNIVVDYVEAGVEKTIKNIVSWDVEGNSLSIGIRMPSNYGYNVGDSIKIKNIYLIDLTDIFGYGNEPSVDEFNQLINNLVGHYFMGTVNIGKIKDIFYYFQNLIKTTSEVLETKQEVILNSILNDQYGWSYSLNQTLNRDPNIPLDIPYNKPILLNTTPIYYEVNHNHYGLKIIEGTKPRIDTSGESFGEFGIGLTFKFTGSSEDEWLDNNRILLYGFKDTANTISLTHQRTYQRLIFSVTTNGVNYDVIMPTNSSVLKHGEVVKVYIHVIPHQGIFMYQRLNGETLVAHILANELQPIGELRHIALGHRLRELSQDYGYSNSVIWDVRIDNKKPNAQKYILGGQYNE